MFGAKFCCAGDRGVVVVEEEGLHEGLLGVVLQSTAGVRNVVGDGQEPSDACAEPSGHVCGDIDVLSIVDAGELPLLPVDSEDVAEPALLPLPLLPLSLPLPPLLWSSLPPVVVPTLVLSVLLLSPPPPPLLPLLLCFFANAISTLLLPVTKVIVDTEDTSVSTRNTKIIFLAG